MRYDAACCAATSSTLLLANTTLSQLHCFHTPIPSHSCALAIPTRFMCCVPYGGLHALIGNHSKARLFGLDEVSRDMCDCSSGLGNLSIIPQTAQLASQELPTDELCTETSTEVNCRFNTITIDEREVHYQLPDSAPPAGGHPTVLVFHCWGRPASTAFRGDFGHDWDEHAFKAQTTRALLDAGFAVVAPSSDKVGYWNTNGAPYNGHSVESLAAWNATDNVDHKLMLALLDKFTDPADSDFGGKLSPNRLHAAGFSSGGYMASRMAFNYRHKFHSLAIGSAGWFYQSCGPWASTTGSPAEACAAPDESLLQLLPEHPPTLLLGGKDDEVVEPASQEAYYTALAASGAVARHVTKEGVGHAWLSTAPQETVDWFKRHDGSEHPQQKSKPSESEQSKKSSTSLHVLQPPV